MLILIFQQINGMRRFIPLFSQVEKKIDNTMLVVGVDTEDQDL